MSKPEKRKVPDQPLLVAACSLLANLTLQSAQKCWPEDGAFGTKLSPDASQKTFEREQEKLAREFRDCAVLGATDDRACRIRQGIWSCADAIADVRMGGGPGPYAIPGSN